MRKIKKPTGIRCQRTDPNYLPSHMSSREQTALSTDQTYEPFSLPVKHVHNTHKNSTNDNLQNKVFQTLHLITFSIHFFATTRDFAASTSHIA